MKNSNRHNTNNKAIAKAKAEQTKVNKAIATAERRFDTVLSTSKNPTPKAKTTAKTKHQEHTTTFADLLREYEKQATNPTSEKDYTNALYNLAKAVTYSALNKRIDPQRKNTEVTADKPSCSGMNKALQEVKRSVTIDKINLDNLDIANLNAFTWTYNKDGDLVPTVNDEHSKEMIDELISQVLGDGLDLVHTAVCSILEQTQALENLSAKFMEQKHTVRRLKKKVWIRDENSVNGWETVETTPIQEAFAEVGRDIHHSRAVQADPRNGYIYFSELSTDPESDTVDIIYRRYGKFADLGGYEIDSNGRPHYIADITATAKTTDEWIKVMNLNKRQTQVLLLRLTGRGYKSIGTYLGIDPKNVSRTCKQMRKKAIECGLVPPYITDLFADLDKLFND